jgi:4,5-dihydroxyphthalate decarboxylase
MQGAEAHHTQTERLVLRTAIGQYPHTKALTAGLIPSDLVTLDIANIPTINRAFAPMAREQRFDVCEMAIATFLQAKAYAKPLVLLPVVLSARFQQSALLCRADSNIRGPKDLVGRRVGVRAYSQTTGMWLRGMLAEAYDVRAEDIRWITFEDAHVAEYRDPSWAERAQPGRDLLPMLREGELDAVIVGNDVPNDPTIRTVFPDPKASAEAFWREYGVVPVNHMVTVRRDLAQSRPDLIVELVRLFREAKAGACPVYENRDPYPIGRAALQPAMRLALRYTAEQGLLPHRLDIEDVWEGLPTGLGQEPGD